MREIFSQKSWERKVIVFFVALTLLTVLGPFGTYEIFGFWERLVYWAIIITGVGFFMTVIVLVTLRTERLGSLNQVIRIAIGSVLAGLPGAVVVIFADNLMRAAPIEPDELPWIWVQVALIGIVISMVEFFDWGRPDTQEAPPVRTRFQDRMSPDSGQVISLSMQDHYVEATCENGSELILMRLSDAIAEMDGFQGLQTHRSHWVALDAAVSVEKSGQKMSVVLKDGRQLPVSATFADQVMAAVGR